MNSRSSVAEKPRESLRIIVEPTPTSVSFDAFAEVAKVSGITYCVSPKHITLNEMIGIAETGYIKGGIYLTASPLRTGTADEESPFRYMLQRPIERSKPIGEPLSALKPEFVGLGIGGVLSFGIGIFALATHSTGLATVMAGPFLASVLGFALLLTGFKRKK